MATTLVQLPTEILEAIFLHLDPRSLISVSQTSKFINKITSDAPLIWRHFCRTQYKTWAPHHNIATKFAGPLSAVDWRSLFVDRVNIELEARQLVDYVLETSDHRIAHINSIANFGYDVKETLLKEYACPDGAEDVLARRYYAKAALERIQRDMAIILWKDLSNDEDVPIEKALGAYDVFTRIGEDVDFDTITSDVNRLANTLLEKHPGLPDLSTRSKATTIASFLHEEGFRGVSEISEASYHALRNNFIGLALHSTTHDSLPLISVAIFCALASRFGLDARPCGLLTHVYCMICAPKDYTADGEYRPTNSDELDTIYFDPFRSADEVKISDLQRSLRVMGVPTSEHNTFLTDTNTREIVFRTARNIMTSVQTIRQGDVGAHGINSTSVSAYPDMDSSFYAAIWAMFVLGEREQSDSPASMDTRRRQYLPYLLDHMRSHHPWDISLLQRHVLPYFENRREHPHLERFIYSMISEDNTPKSAKRRIGNPLAKNVHFKIGQLFKHKRYQYEGVIVGWSTFCEAGEEWILNMGVDSLDGGRQQSFYHVLVSDKCGRYVAEENIAIVPYGEKPSPGLLELAGRYFKRWDTESGRFVSNITEEYPDD